MHVCFITEPTNISGPQIHKENGEGKDRQTESERERERGMRRKGCTGREGEERDAQGEREKEGWLGR